MQEDAANEASTLEFLNALGAGVSGEGRLIVCGFPGDPDAAPVHAWRPHAYKPGARAPFSDQCNGYVTVSSFGRAGDGSYRRRNETFCAGHALMVDDVGTKVDPAVVAHMPPTIKVETSPGNAQWWYVLTQPEADKNKFDAVIRAFIAGRLLGNDPGMNGVTRVGRMPGYLNGKAKYGGAFRVHTTALTERRYALDELIAGFQLQLRGQRYGETKKLVVEEFRERNRAYAEAYKWMRDRRVLKGGGDPDRSGWTQIQCPWVDHHTGGVDNGAAIREPSEENDFYGAFRCHHGHCIDKGWADLTDWINDCSLDELERAAQ